MSKEKLYVVTLTETQLRAVIESLNDYVEYTEFALQYLTGSDRTQSVLDVLNTKSAREVLQRHLK